MNWTRALGQCAHVMAELHGVRDAGFTEAALTFPRSRIPLRLLCAFNGAPAGWEAPRGWRYYPNAASEAAWMSVVEVAPWAPDALTLAQAYAPCIVGFANEPMRKAWERVYVAARELVEAEAA